METLLVAALIGVVAWFFLSGAYKTNIKDPETLREAELEDAFVELKKKILVTSAYDQEQTYQRLYYRINAVLAQIMERHKHFVLDVEAKSTNMIRLFGCRGHLDENGMTCYEYVVSQELNMSTLQPDVLLYLCFFLWRGGQAKDVGNIENDQRLMLEILDHLIAERDYPPASFFKGIVLKYGTKVYEPGNYAEARILLEFAQNRGVGAAAIELRWLHKYAQLDGIKSVNF